MNPSAVRREEVSEILHGLVVLDPYRWLEDRDSPETKSWIATQKVRHDQYFAALESLGELRMRVRQRLDIEWRDQPVRRGTRLFYRLLRRGQEQACICSSTPGMATDQVLVDPSTLGPYAFVNIHQISSDGELLAYELRTAASDAAEIHVVSSSSAKIYSEHLPQGYARGFAFTPCSDGFIYCHEELQGKGDHLIGLHFLDSGIRNDTVLLRLPRKADSRLVLITDDVHIVALYTYPTESGTRADMYIAGQDAPMEWSLASHAKKLPFIPRLGNGRLFVITEENAPNRKIIEVSDTPNGTTLVVPESDAFLQQAFVLRDRIYASYLFNGMLRIFEWSVDGVCLGTIPIRADCSVSVLVHPQSDASFFYTTETLSEPPQTWEYLPQAGKSQLVFTQPDAHISSIPCRSMKLSYETTDRATVPMTLHMRADLTLTCPRPMLLTSYGGFGIASTQRFSAMMAILIELGVVVAIPGIRGGSEFGKAWHDAGRGQRRQRAFDDFIEAAEFLQKHSWTSSNMLGLCGGSNSGLLIGVVLTQRPDLFGAAVCIGPLLDMVRYERFDRAKKWVKELGTVEKPADFYALFDYSPYHRIKDCVNYPSILFVSGDSDDRCNPAHVRKTAALLQRREAQVNPILVDYTRERGHRPGLPLSSRIDAIARRLAFLLNELHIPVERSLE